LSVRDNVRYFARMLGAPTSDVERVIEEVGLDEQAHQLVGRLSGGKRERVSLATALLGEPELLVLDEPTVGVDPVLRRDLWDRFRDLAAAGASLLVSSHVMDEAARCDRLLLMREGRLLADDTPDALLARTGTATVEDAFLALIEESVPA
ncbi:MAG TPA: ABC transporter ATP-binding protein, partial [Acidimicrobiales bacterium]